jgi:hypothetical protein
MMGEAAIEAAYGDSADEILHVNLARRQLTDWLPGGVKELSLFAQRGRLKRN